MECQNRTISRGSASIFSRLRKEGIDVSPYFFAKQAFRCFEV
jgi:phospholipase D1/2